MYMIYIGDAQYLNILQKKSLGDCAKNEIKICLQNYPL